MIKATGTILNGAPKAEIDSTISGHFLSGKNRIYLCTLFSIHNQCDYQYYQYSNNIYEKRIWIVSPFLDFTWI